jgi:acyl-CoA-dependent ceramide synthase
MSLARKRSGSVGKIEVGDTAAASLSTMPITKQRRKLSQVRIEQLNQVSQSKMDNLKKIYLGFKELSYRQTWINPLIVLIIIICWYFFSDSDSQIHQILQSWIFPSYKLDNGMYGKGKNDFYFVGFYALVFTFLREFFMCVILRPLAIHFGITKEDKIKRFMEQAYSMIYYGCSGPFGLWIMKGLPLWYFNTQEFYLNYPHKTHDFYFKFYYLGQAAFWVQQSVVLALQLEKPRKDFKELVVHHIITIALIWNSYRFHFTWMGLAVYITMDVSDFFLATSKTLNYLDSPLTSYFFVTFVGVWIYLRHYINLKILWSIYTEFSAIGDFKLNWDTQQYKCYISQPIVFFLIGALQIVNGYWLFLILRILKRYIVVGVPEDVRSDDESEDSEDDKKNQ